MALTEGAAGRRERPTDDNPGGPLAEVRSFRRAVRPSHAASLILWRQGGARGAAEVLMGLRHMRHRFMPGVLVFPGGRVDRADYRVKALGELPPLTRAGLQRAAPPSLARALGVTARQR